MAQRYKDRIVAYCEAKGIEVPGGFHRHSASRYVAIDMDSTPPKLVARTWFSQQDAEYFLRSLAPGRNVRLLDFKERHALLFDGGSRLQRGDAFSDTIESQESSRRPMHLDQQHPLNKKVIDYLSADRKRPRSSAEPIMAPDQHADPYMQAGCHPDCVERVWDVLGTALPADSRALVYGCPALVHPVVGVVLALAFGTEYVIRIPADSMLKALELGCVDRRTRTGGGQTLIRIVLGDDWLFGCWADDEKRWIARVYSDLG